MCGGDVFAIWCGVQIVKITLRCRTTPEETARHDGKSARWVRCGGGWKRIYGQDIEALPTETGRNKLGLTFGTPRQSSTRPALHHVSGVYRDFAVDRYDGPPNINAPFRVQRIVSH